jgi:chromosomal replication initiator protein
MLITDTNEGVILDSMKPENVDEEMDLMIKIVAHTCGLTVEQMVSKTRKREIVIPRQICTYFLMKRFNMVNGISSTQIGKKLNKDHSTVLYSVKQVERAIEVYDTQAMFFLNKCREQLLLVDENYVLV